MSEEAQAPTAPAEGPLSVDQAVSLLGSRPAPVEAAPAAEPIPSEAPSEAEDPAVEPIEANDEGEAGTPEPEIPAIEPPKFWDAEAKAKFRELTPEHQAFVLAQADKGTQASAKAIQEAATRAKEAERKAEGIIALADELSSFLPQAVESFKTHEEVFASRWEGVDWVALSQTDRDAYIQYKAQHDAEKAKLESDGLKLLKLNAANQKAQTEAAKADRDQQEALLATVAPELADPVNGKALRTKVKDFLIERGFPDEAASRMSALEASIALDAMRYRQHKANSSVSLLKPKPVAAKVITPTSSAANPQHRSVMEASARLNKSGSTEDAIALLQARRKG